MTTRLGDIPLWSVAAIAIAAVGLCYWRWASLQATAAQRRNVAIGLGAMIAFGMLSALVKRQGAPWLLFIVIDAMAAMTAGTIGLGGEFRRNFAEEEKSGKDVPFSTRAQTQFVFVALGVVFVLLGVEMALTLM